MRKLAVAAGVTAALALGACGGNSDSASKSDTTDSTTAGSNTTTAGGGAGTAIVIKNFMFEPKALKAKVGDTITVTNKDTAVHTLTADDKSVDTGELAPNADGTVKLQKAGTIAYHCEIHDNMKGTIEVQG